MFYRLSCIPFSLQELTNVGLAFFALDWRVLLFRLLVPSVVLLPEPTLCFLVADTPAPVAFATKVGGVSTRWVFS